MVIFLGLYHNKVKEAARQTEITQTVSISYRIKVYAAINGNSVPLVCKTLLRESWNEMNGLHGISNAAGPLWSNLQITKFYPKELPYLDYTAFFFYSFEQDSISLEI